MIRALLVFVALLAISDDERLIRHEICPGATHFYEKHHPRPAWAERMVVVCVVGNHVFLKEKAK
jgi:hypothetical protein